MQGVEILQLKRKPAGVNRRPQTENRTTFHRKRAHDTGIQGTKMGVHELMTLTRKHWTKYLPKKVQEFRESGELNEAIHGAANLAQTEIDPLMKLGHQEHEAREVALREFVLLPEEPDEDDEQARELAAMEAEHQKNLQVTIDPDEDLPVSNAGRGAEPSGVQLPDHR